MKTSRIFRIFMMALDTVILFLLRPFRRFTKLFSFKHDGGSLEDTPHAVEETRPERLGIKPELEVDGSPVTDFKREKPINMPYGEKYSERDGIPTFRGDNLRSGGSFGTCDMSEKKLEVEWSVDTGRLKKGYGSGYWTGSGWTGQPLIARWSNEEKSHMNLSDAAKADDSFTEVIYSTMDGKVYFLDLKTGERTRDEIEVGLPFKGAGALHPSLPILHLGPGDSGPDKVKDYARAYLYSLTDQSKLVLIVTHDPHTALMASTRLAMKGGEVCRIRKRTEAEKTLYAELDAAYERQKHLQELLRQGEELL